MENSVCVYIKRLTAKLVNDKLIENANIIIVSLVHIITMLEHKCLVLERVGFGK